MILYLYLYELYQLGAFDTTDLEHSAKIIQEDLALLMYPAPSITEIKKYLQALCHPVICQRTMSLIKEYQKIPQVAQKSTEWLKQRQNYLTASSISKALGLHGPVVLEEYINQKVTGRRKQLQCDAIKWGNMFEPVATELYQLREYTTVHEFGLIPSKKYPFLAVSPDGIAENGYMLEIKCPYSRQIDGKIKMEYYHQMQEQMLVCDIPQCHFLECSFKLISKKDFTMSFGKSEQGIIVEYYKGPPHDDLITDPPNIKYWYSPITLNWKKLKQWQKQINHRLESNSDLHLHVVKYWRLDVYNLQVVKYDPKWSNNIPKLKQVWDEIQQRKSILEQNLS